MKALGSLGKRACDGLFPLPVEEKSPRRRHVRVSAGLSPLPIEEKAAIGLRVHLQLPFLPACRERGRLKDLACAYNGLFRLPVEEKAITRQVCFGPHRLRDFAPLSRPQCWSAAARRINTFRARRARNFDSFRLLKSVDLSRVENTKNGGAPDTRCS